MLIIRKAYDVMNYDVESMTFNSMDAGRITTSPGYCKNHGISRQSHSRKAMMMENYASIQQWYNPEESVGVNHKTAQEKDIKVSLSTLKRYCDFMGISTNPKRKPISEWYHPWLSVEKNLLYAKITHIKTSQSALYKYCKDNNIPTKGTEGLASTAHP